ncbi:MAG: CAP domain-containing protein [Candidatus Competibacter sp.]
MKQRILISGGLALCVTVCWAQPPQVAEPYPPRVVNREELPSAHASSSIPMMGTATVEWSYHRTADGQHPNGDEQALVWLMNRARQNPSAEGRWLASDPTPAIADGRNYFQVNTGLLQSEFSTYAIKPPAAFDARLYQAAKSHSDNLIARDSQDHQQQFERVTASGFRFTQCRGNVFSYAESALNAHAAWNIDWGSGDGTGMQPERGHRLAIMALDGDYTNVGLAAVPEANRATAVGPLVTTANYCRAAENGTDHFNAFVTGTVWRDHNNNQRYDPGEGYGNVMVRPDKGTYYAVTASGGGYAIPVTASGALSVSFSGGGVSDATRAVTVSGGSVLLDYQVSAAGPTPPAPSLTQLINLSTRGWVGTGDSVMISGFVIGGSAAKKVLITAKGPVLAEARVPSVLNDPQLTLYNASGQPLLSNDNWASAPNAAEIATRGAKPRYPQEAAILTTLNPGAYTAIVRGNGSATGNALVEVYDLESATAARLTNLSTRGWVGTGDSVMISGFVIGGSAAKKVLITAKGPVLAEARVPSVLNDPQLTLYNASGQPLLSNDNWASAPNAAEIATRGAKPRYPQEAAILTTLNPGAYTAIVRGNGSATGNALIEIYDVQ